MKKAGIINHCRIAFFSLFLLTVLLPAGCADLQAVREFAKTSAATADYRQIVADYAESPIRQKRYQPENRAAQLDNIAKERAEQKTLLEGSQKVLVEYMNALGDLAADELPNVDNEIDGLGKALEKAGIAGDGDQTVSKKTATAAGNIARVLTRAALDHWRQQRVKTIIRDNDDNVQKVVAGLREIVLKDFSASLDMEAEAIRMYFEIPIADAKSRDDSYSVPPLARILMLEHLDRIKERRDRLGSYAEVLDTIGKGHSELFWNVDKLEDKALKERLKKYAKDLQALYKAIREIT